MIERNSAEKSPPGKEVVGRAPAERV